MLLSPIGAERTGTAFLSDDGGGEVCEHAAAQASQMANAIAVPRMRPPGYATARIRRTTRRAYVQVADCSDGARPGDASTYTACRRHRNCVRAKAQRGPGACFNEREVPWPPSLRLLLLPPSHRLEGGAATPLAVAGVGRPREPPLSPRPAAMVVRRVIAENAGERARRLAALAPTNVVELLDERYGEGRDMLFDLFHPDTRTTPMPVLMWLHGGAWIGGSKDELAGYFKIVAAEGYSVVALRYSLAPEKPLPDPVAPVSLTRSDI